MAGLTRGAPGVSELIGPSVGSRLEMVKQSKYLSEPAESQRSGSPHAEKTTSFLPGGPPCTEPFGCLSKWDAFKKGLALITKAEAAAVGAK